MLTCGAVGSDVYGLIKELAIRRVEYRTEIHSNESQYLSEGTEVERLRRGFCFVRQQALSCSTHHHLCRQMVAHAGIGQLCLQRPVSAHAHRTEGVTRSKTREGTNGVRAGIRVGGGDGVWDRVGGGSGDVNGDGDGNGVEKVTGIEANEGKQDGNGNEDGGGDPSTSTRWEWGWDRERNRER